MKTKIAVKSNKIKVSLGKGCSLSVPYWIADSGRQGPCLLLTAAQHGNELQGIEVIGRFLANDVPRLSRGRVIAVPMMNLPAIRERRPHVNMRAEQSYGDSRGHNMNRWWPGGAGENETSRLARDIYAVCGGQATHVLDFHCWPKFRGGAVLIRQKPDIRGLAAKLGHRFVKVQPSARGNTLAGSFCASGRVGITYEFSGQYAFDEQEIRRGYRVLINLSKQIGILPGALLKGDDPVIFSDASREVAVKAPASGLFVAQGPALYAPVRRGEVLGRLVSDRTLEAREIRAPVSGYVLSRGACHAHSDVSLAAHHPYVCRGDRLGAIACLK